jgi:drug/metabolite transporter (DMT)-like permease
MPIVAVVIGLMDGELVNFYQLSGMGLIICGVYINSRKK